MRPLRCPLPFEENHVPERSQWLGRLRLLAVYLFIAALVILARPTPALLAAGAILALLGEAVRLWAAGHLQKSVRLAVSGPYARTQNPLYLGRLLILTGLGLAARNPWGVNYAALVVGYAIFFFYYIPRKLRVEGGRLARIHGEAYERYRAAVPILFPSLNPYPGGTEAWSFRQMVRNQEPLVLAGLLVTFAFLCWKLLAF
jgi:protein-S-isoprenylcysteine O-methyltransferase Ste14